jgi:hypothetical protein
MRDVSRGWSGVGVFDTDNLVQDEKSERKQLHIHQDGMPLIRDNITKDGLVWTFYGFNATMLVLSLPMALCTT